jgi:Cu/Ag efflux pump CusA
MVGRAANELRSIPGVAGVGSHVGRAITSDQVVGISSGEIWIRIAPDADYETTFAAINKAAGAYGGLEPSLITYPEKRVGEVLTGSPKDVVVRVYGEQAKALRTQAEMIRSALANTTGLVDLELELPEEEPTVEIQVNLAAAERVGIKPGDVRRAATTLLSGLQVGSLFQEQKVFEVVVWSTPGNRTSVNSIRDLIIDTPAGGSVRLGDVADVRIAPNPVVVKRESVSRYLDLTANVSGRSIAAVEEEIRAGLKKLSFPIEYHAEVVSDKAGGFRDARRSLLPSLIAAAIGIFLLLQAAFGSWRLAAVAFLIIPSVMAGGVGAILLAGGSISIGSYFGFLALLGLSAQNAVALVSRYLALERTQTSDFNADLAVVGAADRAGPVLVTAVTVSLALLPALFINNQPGMEVIYPLAVVVLGGLITSTLIHLFVLPAACLRWWPAGGRDPSLGFDESAAGLRGQGQTP